MIKIVVDTPIQYASSSMKTQIIPGHQQLRQ